MSHMMKIASAGTRAAVNGLNIRLVTSRRLKSTAQTIPANSYAVQNPTSKLEPFKIHRRTPEETDVGIDICYCGVCHSDLHWMRNEWHDSKYPMVPGHEIMGKVVKVGSKVSKLKVGDKVAVGLYVDSCRHCEHCKSGNSNYCPEAVFVYNSPYHKDGGRITYGGFSTFITVDENYVNTVPEGLDFKNSAPLLCAGVTVFSPLTKIKVGKGTKLGINGIGGLGHLAVKIAAAMGAEVTAISHSERKKNDAIKFGAHEFMLSSSENDMKSHSKRFDAILDTLTVPHDVNGLLSLIKPGGNLAMVGLPENPISVDVHHLAFQQRCMSGTLIGSIQEAQDVIDFCAKHKVHPQCEHIQMQQINEALERMIKSDVRYRFVIDMDSIK